MAVVFSQNGVIVRETNNNIGDTKISSVYTNSTKKGFVTPSFNLADATLIEENIVFKASNWAHGANLTLSGGQWYSGTISKFEGIAVYLWANQIEFDYNDNDSEHLDFVTGIPYDFSMIVRKNIIYDKTTGIATCRIYYNDSLVCTYTRSISDLYLSNNVSYAILSNREGELVDIGYIDINKSYIRIDGKLVWGVDNLRKDEAVIGGKTYRTVKMPDGKVWLAENLDLRVSANDLYYNNDEATYGWNGRKYGLLYDFNDCTWLKSYLNEFYPAWRLPTDNEVADLISSVNSDKDKLKSVQYWTTPGTDNYGFNAMPSGIWDQSFYGESFTMCFKTTGTTSSGRIYLMVISDNPSVYQSDVINISDFSSNNRVSIRLVRDAT